MTGISRRWLLSARGDMRLLSRDAVHHIQRLNSAGLSRTAEGLNRAYNVTTKVQQQIDKRRNRWRRRAISRTSG